MTDSLKKGMIPVCEPLLSGREAEYVLDCLKTNWISSQGKYIGQFEEGFAHYCGCKYGIVTTSGTTALHLALATLGIKRGDQVILPAFTMIATAFAVVYTGAEPVLVDSEPETWNIDVNKIEEKITRKTKAIMPVHIYGHPCDMGPIMDIARRHKIRVIEDAAEAHGAEYKGTKVGGIGNVGCFSFYANKIITTGEGGMVITDDKNIAEKARSLKNLSFPNRKRVYLHSDLGFNYRMTNIQAAIGLAQLEKINEFAEMRRGNARLYNNYLKKIPGITLPIEKEWAKNVYWMYGIIIEDEYGISRDHLQKELLDRGIDTRSFFIPMNRQPYFQKINLFANEEYPVAEYLGKRGMYLPSGSGLTEKQIKHICETIEIVRNQNIK